MAVLLYKDLMRVFPQSNVVLTVRDTESWFKSLQHDSLAQSLQLIPHPVYKQYGVIDFNKKNTLAILSTVYP